MENRFNRTDRFILFSAVVLMLLMLFFLYDDSYILPNEQSNEKEVASISFTNSDVRVKDSKHFLWRPVNRKTVIRNGDSIFTGPGSTVTLKFNDGRELTLQENSMFVMNFQKDELKLDLQFGRFTGSLPMGSKISVKGKEIEQPIAAQGSGPVEIKVSSDGTIRIGGAKVNPNQKEDLYSVLKISKNATPEQVRAAFAKLSEKYSAAKNPGDKKAAEMLSKIQDAFKILSNPIAKKQYDISNPTGSNADRKLAAASIDSIKIEWKKAPPPFLFQKSKLDPLKLSWTTSPDIKKYQVQFSKDSNFENISSQLETRRGNIETSGYPNQGAFFVRIAGIVEDEPTPIYSKIEKTEFKNIFAPKITEPLNAQEFVFEVDIEGNLLAKPLINTKWEHQTPFSSMYELQLAADSSFESIIWKSTTKTKELQTPPLKNGNYFVRVRDTVKVEGLDQTWSPAIPFRVQFGEPKKLPAPELITKEINFLSPSNDPLILEWKAVNGASKYLVEVSPTEEFAQKKSYESLKPRFNHQEFNPGKSYFRVFATTRSGRPGEVSETGNMIIKVKKPILSAISPKHVLGLNNEDTGGPQEFDTQWTDLKYPKNYQIQLSKDSKFSRNTEVNSPTPNAKITIPEPGKYFVRVRGLGEDNQPLTRFSNTEMIEYTFKVPLKTPEILEPFDEVSLFFQKSSEPFIWLEWKPVKQALSYNIELALDPNFQRKILTTSTTKRRYLIKNKLPQGLLYWRIQAVGEGSFISNWTEPRSMTVFSGKANENRLPANQRR